MTTTVYRSRSARVMASIGVVFGIIIGLSALLISAYRQYVLIAGTLPHAGDILVQVLPYMAPFCVEGFILYAFIRLYWTRPKVSVLTTLLIYGGAMVLVAVASNIIEANISMGLSVRDDPWLATVLRYIVPIIPVLTALVMSLVHLLDADDGIANVEAEARELEHERRVAEERARLVQAVTLQAPVPPEARLVEPAPKN